MEATENQVRDAAEPEPPPHDRAPDADTAPLLQPTRPPKISRLPGPTTNVHGGGLTEWSESQQNARSQSAIPAPPSIRGLKRELPQSAVQSESKRRPLAERALDYPSKISTPGPRIPRSAVKGQTLASISQLKQPRPVSSTFGSSISSSFAKSFGPERTGAPEKPSISRPVTRASHARSQSRATSRPRTAQGFREEEEQDETENNGMTASEQLTSMTLSALPNRKMRTTKSSSTLSSTRDSSLTARFHKLCLDEAGSTHNTPFDVDGRVGDIESQFKELKAMVDTTLLDRKGMDDALELAKKRVSELESDKSRLENKAEILRSDLDASREEGRRFKHDLEKLEWDHSRQIDDLTRKYQAEIDDLSRKHRTAMDELTRELERLKTQEANEHQQQIEALQRRHQQELEDEQRKREKEIQLLRSQMGNDKQEVEIVLQKKDRELQEIRSVAEGLRSDVQRERTLTGSLQTSISELSASNTTLEAKINSLRSQVEFLESDTKAQSNAFTAMETRLQDALRIAEEARQRLIKEETERRVLFNKYQELKGNIRVMCRVRPPLGNGEGQVAQLSYPDEKTSTEIMIAGPEEKSSLGIVQRKNYPFEFDRVFTPEIQNNEIFDEISQLVQSALDGYNVCIFCYGQTGSGKTYTMSSPDGMIPRATHMIYDTVTKLKEKSWEYTMEGSFVEVYNEELNDLLTPSERTAEGRLTKKLEIRHDEARKQTSILGCKSVRLNSADTVELMLEEAQRNRSVAATKANERSSRSHSVFILKLVGENSATGERCEGTLNLVDLAGSERLKHSQVEGDRMKETQNINKSLSCLGDVIEALGRGSGHIPYRNSKLTHLLQYSLGGNSKTLMFVMVSPLETHLKETLTSLRFATKVHNTHIGTARATKKIRADS
ncbi:kinesin [Trichoderma longibrachiatum ATCC 18648]|uniref:Kinesin-like protein n=1 Tax=Trichoderma longibrachiatum ATCC 18648 TaxID=983965 RepID=A0A2T4BSD6_TRILO|nr:kinesin [Trichoderma longibrachiatum ATCC 18648]